MKKIDLDLSKLKFDKEKITSLQELPANNLMGGGGSLNFTGGCTDGCGLFGSTLNCTECTCSQNCSSSFCPLTNTGYPGTLC